MSGPLKSKPPVVPAQLVEAVLAAENILILSHHNPDGDALGSSIGLYLALASIGKKAALHFSGTHTDNLSFLFKHDLKQSDLSDLADYDLVMLLDCHGLDRLGDSEIVFRKNLVALKKDIPLAVIDHHLLDEHEKAEALWYHNTAASSTGEMILEVLGALKIELSPQVASALLLAVVTDTGSFTQDNATPLALAAAAVLVEAGASLAEVNRHLNQGRPPRRLRLMAQVMNSLEFHFDGRLAMVFITNEMLEKSGAELADSEGFVEMLRALAGVTLASMVRVSAGPEIKVSLRSQKEVDASAIATFFGGGGHRQAAAYTDPTAKTVEEAREHLLAIAPKHLG